MVPAPDLNAASPLADWLSYLEQLNPDRIELGLDRVRRVYQALGLDFPATRIVLVAGTNGKGSTATLLARLGAAAGLTTGLYTSPHFLHFNERIEINGEPVDDAPLVGALHDVETARNGTPLTYFEMTTLAALRLYQRAAPELLVLEIGLGGRLDAVNVAPAELGIVTTIGMDHMAWLGDTPEAIAREKAGIARQGRPLLVGAECCRAEFEQVAERTGAELRWLAPSTATGASADNTWQWRGMKLPRPRLPTASAFLALEAMAELGIEAEPTAIARVLSETGIPGRLQTVHWRGRRWVLDVGHNPQAAAYVARELAADRPWQILLGQLGDKDVGAVVQSLAALTEPTIGAEGGHNDNWHLAGLNDLPRGLSAGELRARGGVPVATAACHESVAAALDALAAQTDERPVLVCGSFHTVARALMAMQVDTL